MSQWESLLESLINGQKSLYDLDWKQFEDLMGEVLEKHGWKIRPMGYTKDGGIDIVAARHVDPGVPIKMLVQCKRYKKTQSVGIRHVREVFYVKWTGGFHQAMLATTSRFTKGARVEAATWSLDLRDHDSIIELCKATLQKEYLDRGSSLLTCRHC